MIQNSAERLRSILMLYADGDDLFIKWSHGSPETPFDESTPESLVISNVDSMRLATLFTFENGFDTVLSALGTTAEEFNANWQNRGTKLRVRRSGEKFEIRNVTW